MVRDYHNNCWVTFMIGYTIENELDQNFPNWGATMKKLH